MNPSRSGRRLLPLVIAIAAITALGVTHAHYQARDRDRALLIAQTARIGPGTRGRIAAYLQATRPGHALEWRAPDPAFSLFPTLFAPTRRVELHLALSGPAPPAPPYQFDIHLVTREVTPADPATAALLEEIATWAAQK